MKAQFASRLLVALALFTLGVSGVAAPPSHRRLPASGAQSAQYVILLIADGWGYPQIQAAESYTGTPPPYAPWTHFAMSTFSAGGSYNPSLAWSNFNYVTSGATDSAAAATAMYSGVKTANGRISVTADAMTRLITLADQAREAGRAVGAVSTVYLSHATPGAWFAHNDARGNGFAIADEGLWGDPNTTGTPADDPRYGGGHGITMPPVDVALGAGHPGWQGGNYINWAMRDKLATESGQPGAFTFVERIAGSMDGGPRLVDAASDPAVRRLAALFGGVEGNLEYRLADGSGHNPENPTLAEMTAGALAVLGRQPDGFTLLVEGGAVDWAGHANNMDQMVGELIGFHEAIQAVIDWVEEPANDATWDNTLVVVTGDHETGYLTAGPGIFPDQPLGEVNPTTLGLEKLIAGTSRRASWEDLDGDSFIDPGETVYWAWNSGAHTNSLIPLYANGTGADLFAALAGGSDPVRGAYLDNTDIHMVLDTVFQPPPTPTASPTVTASPTHTITPPATRTPTLQPATDTLTPSSATHTPTLLPATKTPSPPSPPGAIYLPLIRT